MTVLVGHGFPHFDPVAVGDQNGDAVCEQSPSLC